MKIKIKDSYVTYVVEEDFDPKENNYNNDVIIDGNDLRVMLRPSTAGLEQGQMIKSGLIWFNKDDLVVMARMVAGSDSIIELYNQESFSPIESKISEAEATLARIKKINKDLISLRTTMFYLIGAELKNDSD